jgi:anti-anti-sigma factor
VTALLQRGDTPAEEPEFAETPAPLAAALVVELDVHGTACRLTLRGELRGTSLAALEAQVDQLGCLPCEQVVVDMGAVTALDEVGAKVILGLYYYVLGRGGSLRVAGMSGDVARSLHAVGGDIWPFPAPK